MKSIISFIVRLRFLFVLIPIFLISGSLKAQGSRQSGERPPIGTISGKVFDETSRQALEFSTVALLSWRDSSIVSGGMTNAKGAFKLEAIPAGRYRIRVNFIGYFPYTIDSVFINPQNPELYYQSIMLKPAVASIQGVEITESKGLFQNSIDRKVFNVEKSISTSGGTALDVLEKVPSVDVDMDGKVSLRGSENVRILIDGKPTFIGGSALEQIPASAIESVEIITNPSAKYDPDGMTGIINIITKHNILEGFNGNLNLNYSTLKRNNAGLNLNFRYGIANYYVNYNYRKDLSRFTRYNLRENFNNPASSWFIQDGTSIRDSESHTIKSGIDLTMPRNQSLGFSILWSTRTRDSDEIIDFERRDYTYTLKQYYTRGSVSASPENNIDLAVNYRKKFSGKDHFLTSDISFSKSNGSESNDIDQLFYNTDLTPASVPALKERTNSDNFNMNLNIQLDYTKAFSEKFKIESGLKAGFRSMGDNFLAEQFIGVNQLWMEDTNRTNNFVYSDEILAAYGIISGKINKLGWQTGLRAEQAYTHPELKTSGEKFDNPYFSFFPSAYLSYDLNSSNLFMLNYSRRINRPSTWSLNPFANYTDPLNIRKGNPFLNPEYVNAFELSHAFYRKSISLTSTAYYRVTNDVITRFRQTLNDSMLVITEANLNKSESYGYEFISMVQIAKWWNINYSFNLFESRIDGSNIDAKVVNQGFSWNNKLSANFVLPYQTELQLSGMYFAPQVVAQGTMKSRYWADFGLRKVFLNKKASIGLRISDVFNTRAFEMAFREQTYRQDFKRKRDETTVFVNFTYRFGSAPKQQEQQKGRRPNQNENQDMDLNF